MSLRWLSAVHDGLDRIEMDRIKRWAYQRRPALGAEDHATHASGASEVRRSELAYQVCGYASESNRGYGRGKAGRVPWDQFRLGNHHLWRGGSITQLRGRQGPPSPYFLISLYPIPWHGSPPSFNHSASLSLSILVPLHPTFLGGSHRTPFFKPSSLVNSHTSALAPSFASLPTSLRRPPPPQQSKKRRALPPTSQRNAPRS